MSSSRHIQQELFSSGSDSTEKEGNVQQFPTIGKRDILDDNPAIKLFGRRFYKEQTELEYLVEFLLLFISDKEIGEKNLKGYGNSEKWEGFPNVEKLKGWPEKTPLKYFPPMRLILKLFSFLGSSNVESRHKSHLEKYGSLISDLKHTVRAAPSVSEYQTLDLIEQVLLGFVGIAGDRTWCAHSFLPLSPGLIAGETIWEKTKGKREPKLSWDMVWEQGMFTFSNHNFLARGGEVLYLQLCNLFRMLDTDDIAKLENRMGYSGIAEKLQGRVEEGLKLFLTQKPAPLLDKLSRWVESVEKETEAQITQKSRGATCGWCPEDSWPEAYLFAYELVNICEALLDPIEKVEMLKLCCIFQVLRSLSAQAGRHWPDNPVPAGENAVQPFTWVITDPDLNDRALKEAAKRNLVRVQEMIHGALRTRKIQEIKKKNTGDIQKTYKNADQQGQELFVKLGKKIGLIVPYQGPGARFVLNETLLRYLVLALVPPGKRMRLSTFLEVLYRHYGAAVSGPLLNDAIQWTYPEQNVRLQSLQQEWVEEKLRATGFLIPLSDAVSLIHNTFTADADDE